MTDAGLTGVEQEVTSVLDVTSRYVVQIRVSGRFALAGDRR
jgi:hypothetical protein